MGSKSFSRSFGGGEVTPEFWGQISDAKFQTGLSLCRNFEVLPHGPVRNRAGTQFVREVKFSAKRTRVIPFTYSTTQTMVLEFGDQYIRFHTQGATLLSAGVPYEVPTPYLEADLFDLHYVQSADVLTIVHPNYAPRELRRLGALSWTLTTITFASTLAAPGGVGAVATPGPAAGPTSAQDYVVTALSADGLDESVASAVATCSNNLYDYGAKNTISWSAVAGAALYNVYRKSGGLFGYVGQTAGLSMVDQGGGDVVAPDISRTPPFVDTVFNSAGNYPAAVSYHEQRRWFGGTTNEPSTFWATRSGTESNMGYFLPTRDDGRIKFRAAAREANTIRHIVPLTTLVLLTSSAEWRVTSINTDALTPTSTSVKPQSYIGANNAQPVVVNNNLLYAAARGGHVRELAYSWQASGYVTGDTSLRATHLFDGLDIVDLAYSKAPYPIVWAASSNGKLLGLTYVPEQQIGAWHQHDTAGLFESVCTVAEGSEDVLYAVVQRTINGAQKRYIEFKHSRAFADKADAFFVDAGVTYKGAPTKTISAGLGHLEGMTVSILGDGAVMPQQVVTGGALPKPLPAACSTITVGLPITADLQTLPLVVQMAEAFGQDRPMNVNRVWLRVYQSSGIFAGPDFDNLTEAKQRTDEPYGTPPNTKTERVQIDVMPSWGDSGQVCIRQVDPLPLTVLSMTIDVALGGG